MGLHRTLYWASNKAVSCVWSLYSFPQKTSGHLRTSGSADIPLTMSTCRNLRLKAYSEGVPE